MFKPRIFQDIPEMDPKSSDQVQITDQGFTIVGTDEDSPTLIREYDLGGGFGDYLIRTGHTKSNGVWSGPGLPEGGLAEYVGGLYIPPSVIAQYDTIVGVGASICDGIFKLTPQFYQNSTYVPFRGVKFKSASIPGTTLSQILTNITTFTDLVEGNTLFIMMGGGNDCSTLLSAGGTTDGSAGTVIAWDAVPQVSRDATHTRYRDIMTALQAVGDVAIVNMTFRDYKGRVLGAANQDTVGIASWNDNVNIPLCQELTPDWFDVDTGRPVIDFYAGTLADPTVIDDDNVHQYGDYTYPGGGGYPNGPGSYTLRNTILEALYSKQVIPTTPFDADLYDNRILINVGNAAGLTGRPSYQQWANQLAVLSREHQTDVALTSWDSTKNVNAKVTFASDASIYSRANLATADHLWHEGVRDRNILSSSSGTADPITFTFDDVGSSGRVDLSGLYSPTGGPDATRTTKYTITDSDGTRFVDNVNNSITDITTATDEDLVTTFDYRLDGADKLVITVEKGTGSSFGYIGGILIDIAKP